MKILFLDLDGTVREPASGAKFINDPHDQQLITGVKEAIAHYFSREWLLIGITNQGGVAARHKSLESAKLEQKITIDLIPELSRIYFCPDFDGEHCYKVNRQGMTEYRRSLFPDPHIPGELLYQSFRKPGSGMLMLAIDHLQNYPDDCWMIGDRDEDAICAAAAGINFMWADVWRDRFKKGLGESLDLSSRHVSRETLLKFLAT